MLDVSDIVVDPVWERGRSRLVREVKYCLPLTRALTAKNLNAAIKGEDTRVITSGEVG